MPIRSRFLAALGVAALSLGGVLVSATTTSAAEGDAQLDAFPTVFHEGGSWGDGISFTSSGWTPLTLIDVQLRMITGPGAGDSRGAQFWSDDSGTVSGVLQPGDLPLVAQGDGGYPVYEVWGFEVDAGGGFVRASNPVTLWIEPKPVDPPPAPTLVLPVTEYWAGDATWNGGIAFMGTGWTPGAIVTVSLTKEDGQGGTAVWYRDVIAGEDGGIYDTLIPPADLIPELPGDDGYPVFNVVAVEGASERESDTVPLTITEPPGIDLPTIALPVTTFEAGDTWGDGIIVHGSGWAPRGTVTVSLRTTQEGSTSTWPQAVVVDEEGRFDAVLHPSFAAQPPGFDGFPLYSVFAEQIDGGGASRSNEVALTVTAGEEPPVYTPVLVVGPSNTLYELEDGILVPYFGFKPGEDIVFTLTAPATPELPPLVVPAGPEGDGSLTVSVDPSTGVFALDPADLPMLMAATAAGAQGAAFAQDFTLTLVGVGSESGAQARATLTIDVPDLPDEPGDPGDSTGSGAAGTADGQLAATGADRDATASTGSLAAGLIAFGLALVVAANRRRLAGLLARR